jgi:hypothetical protein
VLTGEGYLTFGREREERKESKGSNREVEL